MDLCFSLKCTKNRDDDYSKRSGSFLSIPNYVTEDYILTCHTNNFNNLINLKNNGNRHYKAYKFEQAVHCYTKALASFSQEKNLNGINNSKNNLGDSFDLSNVVVGSSLNEIDKNGLLKKNSTGLHNSMASIPSHISSPLATSSNINVMANNKNSINSKQFPVSENSSYHILKKKSDDEYSNAMEKFLDENRVDASFNSSSPKSPDINPKTDFINHLESQYQLPSSSQSTELRRKPKSKHSRSSKLNHQSVYTPHPKIKSSDVMILYTTLLANRSASFIRLKNFKNANADAEHIIEIRPNWIKGYYRKAEALKGMKKYLESLDYYHQALKFNPSSEKILNAISTIEILLRNEELGIKVYQLVPGYDICVKKSIFKPIQYILFSYALQMQNYVYILADIKSKQCVLIDACWDIDGILEIVNKEKLKVIGAIYTHFHVDHTGGIPPPPYNKYMVRVEGIVKLSKIYPNIPFFIGPKDIDYCMKQNPEFNRKRFIPIKDREILTLDDIVNLSKKGNNNKKRVEVKTPEKLVIPSKISATNEKDNRNQEMKNEILSDDDAIDNFVVSPISDRASTNLEPVSFKNSKMFISVKGRPVSDYKNKNLSNLNEDAILSIPDDNTTEVYSNYNLNDVESDFNNAMSEASVIENCNMGNISNICYDGENSLKFFSEQDGNNNLDGKGKFAINPNSSNRGAPWTSTLERPKNRCKSIEDSKSIPFNDINSKYGKINDTISTISMINIDKKDYSSNGFVKPTSKIDDFRIQFIFTPGHTEGSMCILVNEERLFSGDTLLIGTCGRIDFPESSPEDMYNSLMNVLGRFDDDVVVYPGHSYGGDEWTTIAQEKLFGSMYNYGSYESWLYELTGCVKDSTDGSVHQSIPENRNEMMAMTPISHNSPKPVLEHMPKKELHEEPKSENEENEKNNIKRNNTSNTNNTNLNKKDEVKKGGYFSNHEFFDMNNINSNNKYYNKNSSTSTTIAMTPSIIINNENNKINNIVVVNSSNSTSTSNVITSNENNAIVSRSRSRTNSSNNNGNGGERIIFSKRKDSLSNKPHLQKQQQLQQIYMEVQQQQQQQTKPQPQLQPQPQPLPQSQFLDDDQDHDQDDNKIENNNYNNLEKVTTTDGIEIQSNNNNTVVEIIKSEDPSSLSSSPSSDSLSISSSSSTSEIENNDIEIENYTSNVQTSNINTINDSEELKKSYSIKSVTKQVKLENAIQQREREYELEKEKVIAMAKQPVTMKPSMEILDTPNALFEDVSPANSYDHIITNSIKEQFNKSSEYDELYDESERYDEKNRNILSGLYPSDTTNDSEIEEENNKEVPPVLSSSPRREEKPRKRDSFLNNVFKRKSLEKKHYLLRSEE